MSSERIGTSPLTPSTMRTMSGALAARRHEVDDADDAVVGRPRRLEDERVVAVAPLRSPRRVVGREQPAAVLGRAEERGEAGAGVEAREAEPVDRAVAADERRRLQSPISA